MEECRVLFAIEACAQRVADKMGGYFEKLGVNWQDEHLPEIAKEARNLNDLQSGEISLAEFKKKKR